MAILLHRHPKAGRGAQRVQNNFGGLGEQRLLDVIFGHHAAHRVENTLHMVDGGLVAPKLLTRKPRDRLRREIVGGRTNSAGRDHDVRHLHRSPPCPFEALRHVSDREHGNQVDAGF